MKYFLKEVSEGWLLAFAFICATLGNANQCNWSPLSLWLIGGAVCWFGYAVYRGIKG